MKSQTESIILVNTGLGNGLLLDSTKPLPEPLLTNHQLGFVPFTFKISQEMIKRFILDNNLKTTNLKLQPHLLGTKS